MMKAHQSESKRHSLYLIAICWLVYMSAYIGRNTFKAAIAPIIAQGIMDKGEAGLIETCYFITYGLGHLINGILADRINPYKMVGIGLLGTCSANLIMALAPSYPILLLVWTANGYLQAMLWSPILALFSRVIDDDLRDTACYRIFTSSPVGTILAYLLVAVTADIDYRYTFYIASAFLLLVAVLFLFVSHRAKPHLKDWHRKHEVTESGESKHPLLPLLLKTGVPILVFSTILHGMLKEGVLTWVPSMITETFPVPPSFSVLLAMLLPLSNLGGAFISKQSYAKLFKRHEAMNGCFYMLLSALPIGAVILFLHLNGREGLSPVLLLVLSVICLAAISLLMTGFNYMVSTVIPMRFAESGWAATFSGVFNSSVYVGSAISTYTSGYVAEQYGWNVTLILWLGIALLGTAILVPVFRPWRRFTRSLEEK